MTLADRAKHAVTSVAGTLVLLVLLPVSAGAADDDLEKLHQRARSARLNDRIEESYALFRELADQAQEGGQPSYLYRAEWWLGRIVERWGDLDGALEHFRRALDALETAEALRVADPLTLQRDEIGLLQNAHNIYEKQCKMALVFNTEVRIVTLCDDFVEKVRADALARSCATCNAKTMWSCMQQRAGLLSRAAAYDQYENTLRRVADEAELRRAHAVVGRSLGSLASHLGRFERWEEAVAVSEECESVPVDTQYGFEFFLRTIQHALRLAQRDGLTEEVWVLIDRSLRNLEAPLHYGALLWGQLMQCGLEQDDGRPEEALAKLDAILADLDEEEYVPHRAYALQLRAGCRMNMGQLDAAEDDLKASLLLHRQVGSKQSEIRLYEMYADLLTRQGRYAEALKTWQAAFEQGEAVKMHFRSLHMLLGMTRLYAAEDDLPALEGLWDRIEAFVALHPDLPEPTTLRLHLARLDFLKRADRRAELLQSYEATKAFVDASRLTEHQRRAFNAYQLEEELAPLSPGSSARAKVNLQPILMQTRVEPGEVARGRFVLTNLASMPETGVLEVTGASSPLVWENIEGGWIVSRADAATEDTRSVWITIPPGQERVIYLEAAVGSDEQSGVELRWQGQETSRARWAFEAGEESRLVSVVNASLAEDNPFYSVPFYHEVYYRGAGPALRNLRARASAPCRLEIADAETRMLMAVDANGDGDFEDEGDALYVDEDLDLYPDIRLGNEQDVAAIDIIVYPGSAAAAGEAEIEVSVAVRESGAWSVHAVNTLSLQPARAP